VTPGRYGTIPHTYVTCTRDNTVPIALQRRFITEIDAVSQAPTTVVELDSSHSPFLSQPAALTAAIAAASR
jgi:pimeloyl-ACP methyl ester carboxylesterase